MKDHHNNDDDLFRQALEGVIPLAPPDRIKPASRPHKPAVQNPVAPDTTPDNFSDHGVDDTAITEYLRPGLNRMTLRKLRRGEWPVQDELDLHGLNSDEARRLLAAFLQNATQHRLRCVNVIHGKGWRSEGRDGILKILSRHWLAQHPQVLAFCDAPLQAGGSGAVWVLLKKS